MNDTLNFLLSICGPVFRNIDAFNLTVQDNYYLMDVLN